MSFAITDAKLFYLGNSEHQTIFVHGDDMHVSSCCDYVKALAFKEDCECIIYWLQDKGRIWGKLTNRFDLQWTGYWKVPNYLCTNKLYLIIHESAFKLYQYYFVTYYYWIYNLRHIGCIFLWRYVDSHNLFLLHLALPWKDQW